MPRIFALTLACFALYVACSREREPAPAPVPKQSVQPASVPVLARVPMREPLSQRIVAIGDLHGDFNATRGALRLAGAIDVSEHWSGGKMVLVQTGDQLDRGDDDRKILDLFSKLEAEAKAAGGAVYALNGNHETMNGAGDFRYVTPGGFLAFEEFEKDEEVGRPLLEQFKGPPRGRAVALVSGGAYAKRLAERKTILVLGDTVFVHGGVAPEHVRYGIERINDEVSRFLRGDLSALPPFLQRDDAPMWTRAYSSDPLAPGACVRLGQTLEGLGARRMVVGHTVQREINSVCDGQVWRIDVGLSRYYGGPRQVLEIRGRDVRVLR